MIIEAETRQKSGGIATKSESQKTKDVRRQKMSESERTNQMLSESEKRTNQVLSGAETRTNQVLSEAET